MKAGSRQEQEQWAGQLASSVTSAVFAECSCFLLLPLPLPLAQLCEVHLLPTGSSSRF